MSEITPHTPHAVLGERPAPGRVLWLDDGRHVRVVNVNGRGTQWMHVENVAGGNVFIMTWEVKR